MRRRKRIDLVDLETIAARRQHRAKWLFAAMAGVGSILALINISAGQSSREVDSLARTLANTA